MAGLLVLVATVTACSSNMGLPESATEQGDSVVWLWRVFVILAALIAGLIWVLTASVIITSVRRRRQHGADAIPAQHQYRTGSEIAYTAAPLVIVAVLLAMTLVATNRLTDSVAEPDVEVKATGFQWQWQFEYPDERITISGTPAVLPEMWLPVGRTVRFVLASPDVIHAFWVPEFLEKRDMIPGVVNTIDVTVKAPGQWVGRCAEYCGLYHWQMKFSVCAVDGARYDEWVARNARRPQPVVAGPPTDARSAANANPTPGGEDTCPSAPVRVAALTPVPPAEGPQTGVGR